MTEDRASRDLPQEEGWRAGRHRAEGPVSQGLPEIGVDPVVSGAERGRGTGGLDSPVYGIYAQPAESAVSPVPRDSETSPVARDSETGPVAYAGPRGEARPSSAAPVPDPPARSTSEAVGSEAVGQDFRPRTGPASGPIGGLATGPVSGPLRIERLQADRLVGDRPRAADDSGPLPASLPEVMQPAWYGGGRRAVRPRTRHSRRRGAGPGESPPRADRTLLVYLAAVLLVVGAFVGGGVWLVVRPDHKATGTATFSASAGRALLVGLTDGPSLVAVVVLGAGAQTSAGVVVPTGLLVDAGGRQIPLSGTAAGGAASPGLALGRTLNVRIDAGWLVTLQGFTSLVDAGGGVVVDVDQEIRSGPVLVAAGAGQRLTGAQAVAFVTADRDGESAQATGKRFATVLGQALLGLPATATEVTGQLTALGPASMSDLPAAQLAATLASIGTAIGDAGRMAVTSLPVRSAGDGQETGAVIADLPDAGNLIRRELGVRTAATGAGAQATSGTGTASGTG